MKKIFTLMLLGIFIGYFVQAQNLPIYDDVEGYPSFVINPTTGPWTFVDRDTARNYSIQGTSFPNQGEPAAFITFNFDEVDMTYTVGSPSGGQVFACFSAVPSDDTPGNDDWMISPLLSGTGNPYIFSFWAASYTENYGLEEIQVIYSTTGNNVETDFPNANMLSVRPVEQVPTEWTYYEYEVPADAKYVALRCVSVDHFILFVDDIRLKEKFPYNLEAVALGVPDYACDLTDEEIVQILVYNDGTNPVTTFTASYQIGENGPIVTEEVNETIQPDNNYIYTFNQKADLTFPMDTDSLRGWVVLENDGLLSNDTTEWYGTGVPAAAIVPYYNDFSHEDQYKGWSVMDVNGDGSTWGRVDFEGNPMWYYHYNSDNAANDWLFSSCFDLAAGSYTLEFSYAAYVYYISESFSVYFGTSPNPSDMTLIKSFSDINNTAFAQGSEVFNISDDGIYYIGFKATSAANAYYLFIDNINLVSARNADLSVIEAHVPELSCELTSNETIGATIRNVGLNPVTNFTAYYQVGTTTPVAQSMSVDIASGDTYQFDFSTSADLTIPAIDSVKVWVELSGDENSSNDTSQWEYTGLVASVDTFSYLNEFTNDEDVINWTTIDVDNDGSHWSVVNYAGDMMWYHNGASYFQGEPDANDWLFSSCFDFEEGSYTIKFEYAVYDSPTASFAIYFGTEKTTDINALTLIEDLTLIDNVEFAQLERAITIPQAGTYYFAFYAYEVNYFLFIDDFEVIRGDVVGISDKENISNSVLLYPNPANNMITLQSSDDISQVQIFDIFGKNIANYDANGITVDLSVKNMAVGMYVAKIMTENGVVVKKFNVIK